MRLRRRRPAFVLLEVIVALTILGVAVAALMRSFTQSLQAARTMEIQTQASFLAQQLMEEFEVYPPLEDEVTAGFGEGFPNFYYSVRKRYVEPEYPRRRRGTGEEEIEQYFAMRQLEITIYYQDSNDPRRDFVPLRLTTAVIGFEKYSPQTKRSYSTKTE